MPFLITHVASQDDRESSLMTSNHMICPKQNKNSWSICVSIIIIIIKLVNDLKRYRDHKICGYLKILNNKNMEQIIEIYTANNLRLVSKVGLVICILAPDLQPLNELIKSTFRVNNQTISNINYNV